MAVDLQQTGERPSTSQLTDAAMADAQGVASALSELALLVAAKKTSNYRARAYEKAASTVRSLGHSLEPLARDGRLINVPSIGKGIARLIVELLATGHAKLLDELREEFGPGMRELSGVPGLSGSRIQTLHRQLGISTLAALRTACENNLIRNLPGFGPRSEAKLLASLAARNSPTEGILLLHARAIAERLRVHALQCPAVLIADVVGAVRRWQETVASIEILVGVQDLNAASVVFDALSRAPDVVRCEPAGPNQLTLHLADRVHAVLWVVAQSEYGVAMVRHTGSAAHVARLELPEAGWRGMNEAQIYARIGLPWIPPELRENEGEIEAARGGDTFADLVRQADVRGMVHCHSTYSDGKASIAQMSEAAEKMSMEYITITDHSPSAHYAGGVDAERLGAQWKEIDEVQAQRHIHILRGTESDILRDGQLDYPFDLLAKMDVVIASVHGRMKMNADEMTARLISAMRQPCFKIWGHALGRLLLHRPAFACDVDAILAAAAESRVAIEINGDPHRLDMEPHWARRARKLGIPFVISTDAHSVAQLANLQLGVALARRAGLRRQDVLNTRGVEGFKAAVKP